MVGMFDRVELQTNLVNNKDMVCTPGFIWGKHGLLEYKRRAMGKGSMLIYQKKSG